ncbi:hypothetical protein B0I08_10914 [Glaciihabitans tibetensis]|uniref:Uncharacterized protein n=1 Tax=Glaciihabitans tibetensis TaxID=1266600 RepID=A0A2T0V6R5_9MICO|nr:hypothetical protein B0I08_10914 [Glaciihabitans tibetensis]
MPFRGTEEIVGQRGRSKPDPEWLLIKTLDKFWKYFKQTDQQDPRFYKELIKAPLDET